MRLEQIKIRNFRLLRRFSIDLTQNNVTTILVGPNNSGKTSVMDALRLFIGAGGKTGKKPSIYDLSSVVWRDFEWLQKIIAKFDDKERLIKRLRCFAPRMRMDLYFSYDDGVDSTDLAVASELLVDLDPGTKIVGLRIEFALEKAQALINDYRDTKGKTLFEFLSNKISSYYETSLYKISKDGNIVEPLDSSDIVKRLIKIDIVSAQRHIDDEESSQAAKLSLLLHNYYNNYHKAADSSEYKNVEEAISLSAEQLTTAYESAFNPLLNQLKSFGYPQGHLPPDLKIRAEMSAEKIYKDNTRIYYTNQRTSANGGDRGETFELPEKYNGLGYKNLIYIVLQLQSFQSSLKASHDVIPRVHLIAIEEPEVHLHPQMQCIFIKEISRVFQADNEATPQIILSTHSSHIVADSEFDPIRYFKRNGCEVSVRDLSRLKLELSDSITDAEAVLRFLKRYMKITHCDLFFADKAILIEGQVERLLMPLMLAKCSTQERCEYLASQYISLLEVGGAYAHKFQPLVDFIDIPTLIITDIDSVGSDNKKCCVKDGVHSSNPTLTRWLPEKRLIVDLKNCSSDEKCVNRIRVAYQTEENGNCGRSFEEAFIYANLIWLEDNHSELSATGNLIKSALDKGLEKEAYDLGNKIAKVDFALDLVTLEDWNIPQYINEGLVWLACQGEG